MATQHHDGELLAVNAQDEYYHNARERSIDDDMMEEYSEKPPPPAKKPFYKNKKIMIPCLVISAILIVVIVCLMVFVFFPMICQSLVNQANISVNNAVIQFTQPAAGGNAKRDTINIQNQFYMDMSSALSNTGPFSASIVFENPVPVSYNDTLLGTINLPPTNIGGGHGNLDASTVFNINDTKFFAEFSKDMLALDTFYWHLSTKATVTALGRSATVNMDKHIAIPGMGGFKNVKIQTFDLPSNGPNNTGIVVKLGTLMNSPSPIAIQLGTIKLQIGYQGVNLGVVSGQSVTLQSGDNPINLQGVIQPLTNPSDLQKVGDMFSKYVSGNVAQTTAVGVSCAPDGQNTIQWLSDAFTSLTLNVGLQNQGGPLKIIHGVSMGYLDLAFNAQNAYAPSINAPNVVADWSLPFGFTLDIYQVTQNITMNTTQGGNFSQLVVPWVPSQSNQQAGKLQFAINQGTLQTLPGKNDAFNQYTYDLTASNNYTFGVNGIASTMTSTPIGNLTLSGVTFTVDTSLHGLQFLNSTPTTIGTVDMTGGTQAGLLLNIGVGMGNPSDFSMSVGDVVFNMFAGSSQVGTAALNNLTLQRGANSVVAVATFDPNSSQDGKNMLTSFVEGKNSTTSIAGFSGSTQIASLVEAFQAINIQTTLPGLNTTLVQSANLVVLADSPQTSIVNVAVNLNNPFTAGLAISKIVSSATYKGMPVGNINVDLSGNPFVANGHSVTPSQALPMTMNLEPAALALLMRDLAVDAHLDTQPLDALLGMGGFHVSGQQDVQPSAQLFNTFNISQFVIDAAKALKADLNLDSTLKVGEYQTDLAFVQNTVQVNADWTITRLIPIVGQPIVQAIVNGAVLGFDTLVLSNPTETNAAVQMKGSITKAGPMNAQISFPGPLSVRFQGKEIGTATMPTINSLADQGAQFDVPSNFVITDGQGMQNFAAYMINNPSFEWEIYSPSVSVTALGFTFTNISMDKIVTIKGCNGFKDDVKITSFNLPANDPAGGITLTTGTSVTNPSQVGFNLQSVNFVAYYQNTEIGPLGASPGNFAPAATSNLNMTGRMIPQTSQSGLDAVTTVFENYLNAKDTPLTVKGDSASGPAGQVSWLTNAFKTLTIDNVILPGPAQKPTLIPSITMGNMQLDFSKDNWAPLTSSSLVQAQLKNPFGFPLGVSQLSMEVDAKAAGQNMAHLSIPTEKATTSNTGVVTTAFTGVPFKVSNQDLFSLFMTTMTKSANGSFELAGTSNALTQTAIGNLQLNGITFDVTTNMAGFNNFGGQTQILSLVIAGGTSEYVLVNTKVAFNNPSQITIQNLGDISFTAQAQGQTIGQVFIKGVTIVPGNNTFDAAFHLAGAKQVVGQVFSDYLTNAQVPLSILGTEASTTVAPLKQAFSTVNLATVMSGIQANLITNIEMIVSLESLMNKQAGVKVSLRNTFETPYILTQAQAVVYFNSATGRIQIGHVDSIPAPCTVPTAGQTTCTQWTSAVDASVADLFQLLLSPNKVVDVQQNITTLVGGPSGYESSFYYYQDNTPVTITIQLGAMKIPLNSKISSNSTNDPVAGMLTALSSILGGGSPTPTSASVSASASASASATTTASVSQSASETPTVAPTPSPSKADPSGSGSGSTTTTTTGGGLWPFKREFSRPTEAPQPLTILA
ncbi:hypothetical protein DM01DRAFT_1335066 [Hesseltinella vesiculosa]|uniref:Uncharacterized protein n=1 Tax=Hesseltinella vesiculosa TaxID=101127 RepID=A0A1X2GK49_9FUNG|nr:hypothetical protein DM01DRAFT_1335066 [Hesseltinella vesiculosa]